jgi:hypothetical protein
VLSNSYFKMQIVSKAFTFYVVKVLCKNTFIPIIILIVRLALTPPHNAYKIDIVADPWPQNSRSLQPFLPHLLFFVLSLTCPLIIWIEWKKKNRLHFFSRLFLDKLKLMKMEHNRMKQYYYMYKKIWRPKTNILASFLFFCVVEFIYWYRY